jgi:predicted AAA+ superfamily ATPase
MRELVPLCTKHGIVSGSIDKLALDEVCKTGIEFQFCIKYDGCMIIPRTQHQRIIELAKQFKVISIQGPRQSGKTTLAVTIFSDYEYYNLEDPITLDIISRDPRAFIAKAQGGIIIDEIQHLPELFSHIQAYVEAHPENGKIVITGSQNFQLSEKIAQTLAGRVAICTLPPLTMAELAGLDLVPTDVNQLIVSGGYPGVQALGQRPIDFFSNYLATYIERDVRSLRNIGNLDLFRRFMILLASRVGQLLNIQSLCNDLGVDQKTASAWLSVLEASYIVFRLPPFYQNFGKRLTKRSKLYFYDTGLVSYLLGIADADTLGTHFIRGQLFENLVVSDILKTVENKHSAAQLYFWRDSNGVEVDLLAVVGQGMVCMEIKAGQSFSSEYLKNLILWRSYTKDPVLSQSLVYVGQEEFVLEGCQIVNWRHLNLDWIQ